MDEVFFDVGVGPRHIGLGLVIVVITDKIFHRVCRGKKTLELAIELRGQRLVGRQDEGGGVASPRSPWPWCRSCPEPVDAEQHLHAVRCAVMPFDQVRRSRSAGRPFGSYSDLIHERLAAPRISPDAGGRCGRPEFFNCPSFAAKFGAAVTDQRIQARPRWRRRRALPSCCAEGARPARAGIFFLGGEAEFVFASSGSSAGNGGPRCRNWAGANSRCGDSARPGCGSLGPGTRGGACSPPPAKRRGPRRAKLALEGRGWGGSSANSRSLSGTESAESSPHPRPLPNHALCARGGGEEDARALGARPPGALSPLAGEGWVGVIPRTLRPARLASRFATSPLAPFVDGPGAPVARPAFAAGAAIPRIIRRRLQTGGRTDAAFSAAIDRGIEQFR